MLQSKEDPHVSASASAKLGSSRRVQQLRNLNFFIPPHQRDVTDHININIVSIILAMSSCRGETSTWIK